MKDKADNLRGRGENELTQAYKYYADYDFPNDETCHPRCENVADSVLCTPTNDECQLNNWTYTLEKCTAFTSIALPGFERDSANWAPMIKFNTYITKFTC